jgi:hypothetical protein
VIKSGAPRCSDAINYERRGVLVPAGTDDYFRDALGFGLFTRITRRNSQNWESMTEVSRESWRRRAVGNLDFIPSGSGGQAVAGRVEVAVRAIPDPIVRPREATADEIPRSAKQTASKLSKHGWTVRVEYGKHSWPKQTESVEDESGEVVEKIKHGIVESIVVKARKGQRRMFAIWMTKPWTKDGDVYKFMTAHFLPNVGKVSSPEMNKQISDHAEGGEEDGSEEDGPVQLGGSAPGLGRTAGGAGVQAGGDR